MSSASRPSPLSLGTVTPSSAAARSHGHVSPDVSPPGIHHGGAHRHGPSEPACTCHLIAARQARGADAAPAPAPTPTPTPAPAAAHDRPPYAVAVGSASAVPPQRRSDIEALATLVARSHTAVADDQLSSQARHNAAVAYAAQHNGRPSHGATVDTTHRRSDDRDGSRSGVPGGGPTDASKSPGSFLSRMGAITVAGVPLQPGDAAAAVVAAVGSAPSHASHFHKAEAIRMYLEHEVGAAKLLTAHRLLATQAASTSHAEVDEQLLSVVGDEYAHAVPLLHQLHQVERQLSGQ